ncbi:MAG: SIS domain-containing protein [Sphingomonadaceae bacterium]
MPSYMAREIAAQPEVLRRLFQSERESVEEIAAWIREFDPCFAFVVARGSSDNAALYGKYLFGAVNRLPVALAAPSLFTLFHTPPDLSRALVIAISQSGQSPDLLEVAQNARAQGAVAVAVTNDPASPLAGMCQWVIPVHAGEERSVAATKSYTAQLMALAMLSASLAQRPDLMEDLKRLPEQVKLALQSEAEARAAAELIGAANRCVVIGRGFDLATAQEIALKLKELAAVAAEAYSAADFMHGPLAMVEPGFPALMVAPGGVTFEEMSGLARRLSELGVEVAAISDRRELLDSVAVPIPLRGSVKEWLHPFVTVVPGQLLALHLTLAKGLDPDRPRRLSKVTRTR